MAKIKETSIVDFFNTLKKYEGERTTYIYYTSPVKVNKSYMDCDDKLENPVVDKLYKSKEILFNYGDTFKEAMLKINPDYEFKGQKADYEHVDGSDILLSGKNGLYLPILPLSSTSEYFIKLNEKIYIPVTTEKIKKLLPPSKEYTNDRPIYNQLLVSRISKIESDINYWINEEFEYQNIQ